MARYHLGFKSFALLLSETDKFFNIETHTLYIQQKVTLTNIQWKFNCTFIIIHTSSYYFRLEINLM